MADKNETDIETAPPATDAETGVAMDGEFPHNHRLRAEAMARAGVAEDPDGLIPPGLITDAAERIKRDDAAAEKAAKAEAAEARAAKGSSNTASTPPADTTTDSKGA